jgi:hypothetical protein
MEEEDNRTEFFQVNSMQEILANIDPAVTEGEEVGYRRGYVQGYFISISDRNKGFDIDQQLKHLERLMNWRNKNRGKFILPPEITLEDKEPEQ